MELFWWTTGCCTAELCCSLQVAVLRNLWNISKQEAQETVDALWAYGLVQFTDIAISCNITQHCVEDHAVISQHIIECIDSNEVHVLAPAGEKLNTLELAFKELHLLFNQLHGVHDPLLLTVVDLLKYKLNDIEYCVCSYHCTYLKLINMQIIVIDPHYVIQILKSALMKSPYTVRLLSLLDEEINSLIVHCKESLHNAHKLCRKLNQEVQRNFTEQNYDKL